MANMAYRWLLLAIVVSVVPKVFSLQCYKCVREDNPDASEYCALLSSSSLGNNSIINCTGGEDHCAIVKTITKSGSVTTFRRSCSQTELSCEDTCSSPDSDGVVICSSCCDKDLCNKGIGPKPEAKSSTSRVYVSIWLLRAVIGGCLLLFHL